jgi:BirA family transcriptional regulator, biotin operon repressor / biotin---[acetyl-CoA-carboxylase] ligase
MAPVFHRYDTVGSTNDVALELAKSGCPHGTVVVAQSQTAGKGRLGRQWWDRPGESVLMSLVFWWDTKPSKTQQSAFAVSLGAAEAITERCRLVVRLKWPNDLIANDRKLGGILVEAHKIGDGTAVVAGIGVNVLQSEFPGEFAGATSILALTGASHDTDQLAESIALTVTDSCDRYAKEGFASILCGWRKRQFGVGKSAKVTIGETVLQGTILGVDDSGRLMLRLPENEVHSIVAADSVRIL